MDPLSNKVSVAVAESTPPQIDVEDEDIEEELKNLELEVESENLQAQISKTRIDSVAVQAEASESAEALSDALTNLKLSGNSTRKSAVKNPVLA